jgi:hypothetical protein
LLAHHQRRVKATKNGITLQFGKKVFNYRNERTGEMFLNGESGIAWFNWETPDLLTVTDMNRENAFLVERSQVLPAIGASRAMLAQELGRVESHLAPAKTLYRVIKSKHRMEFRQNIVTPQVVDLGRQIETQSKTISRKQDIQAQAERICRKRGIAVPENLTPERFRMLQEFDRSFNQEEK